MLRGSASLSESNTVRSGRTQRCTVCQTQSTLTLRPALRGPDCWSLWTLKSPKNESCASPFCAGRALKHCHDVWPTSSTFNNPTGLPQWIIMIVIYHGSLNVPIEHHPTIRYMVYNGYYKVMSNISKMGQLPTPVFRMIGSLKLCMCHCCSYNIRTLQNSPILVEKHPRYSAMGLWNKQLYPHVLHDLTQSH